MFKAGTRALVAAALVIAGVCRFESVVAAAGGVRPVAATTGSVTTVPFGWFDFCRRYGGECDAAASRGQDVDLTGPALREVERVNRMVNAAIEPVSDMDHWGVVDQWDYPTDGKGDCEDYALLKRKLLMQSGFPRRSLLMTVVRDRQNEGHAVLTLKTDRGDYVLDNLSDKVQLWTETAYRFVKRQSQEDPNVWVSLGDPGPAPLYTAR